jgi:hypothetical protein
MPFIQVIDNAKPVNNVLPFRSRFERAREFIEYFAAIPKNRFYSPGKLETEADIRNCAFHVVDLVSAYNGSDVHLKNCMGSLLDIFGSKIGHNNPKDRSYIENWKSVQYLHNACYQEAKILEVATELGFPLQRNRAATGLNGDNWYLFAQGDERVKGYADFIYTYANGIDIKDNKNIEIKVDAKIYLNTGTEAEAADPAAHDAVFLIEYILDDELWQLKQIDRNAAKLDSNIVIQVEEKLNNFIRYLNKNSIKFDRVNKYLKKY